MTNSELIEQLRDWAKRREGSVESEFFFFDTHTKLLNEAATALNSADERIVNLERELEQSKVNAQIDCENVNRMHARTQAHSIEYMNERDLLRDRVVNLEREISKNEDLVLRLAKINGGLNTRIKELESERNILNGVLVERDRELRDVRGSNALSRINSRIVDDILNGRKEFTSLDMEYWDDQHQKLIVIVKERDSLRKQVEELERELSSWRYVLDQLHLDVPNQIKDLEENLNDARYKFREERQANADLRERVEDLENKLSNELNVNKNLREFILRIGADAAALAKIVIIET